MIGPTLAGGFSSPADPIMRKTWYRNGWISTSTYPPAREIPTHIISDEECEDAMEQLEIERHRQLERLSRGKCSGSRIKRNQPRQHTVLILDDDPVILTQSLYGFLKCIGNAPRLNLEL
jgi:hypothetical protein